MISLIRLSNGNMNINDSITLEELEVKPTIILLAEVLHDFSRYDVRECDRIKVINGVKIKDVELPEDEFVVYNDNEILGIGHSEDKILFMDVRL